jgi:hypothetical protein
MATFNLVVGKIRTTAPKYPSEAGYVSSINAQLKDLKAIIQSIFDQFENATPDIMLAAVQPTFEKSKVYCPKKTGALVSSGYTAITATGRTPRVEVGYAKGGSPFYAVFVHEMTGIFHNPPTRSKWLQAAMMEDTGVIRDRLVDGYRAFSNSGQS